MVDETAFVPALSQFTMDAIEAPTAETGLDASMTKNARSKPIPL